MSATNTKVTPAERVVMWARRYGVESTDLRFCAHEAYHALDVGLPLTANGWDTDAIHYEIGERGPSEVVTAEVEARAAEWLVCEALGVAYDVEHWAFVSFMESYKNGLGVAMPKDVADQIRAARTSKKVQRFVRTILKAGGRKSVLA